MAYHLQLRRARHRAWAFNLDEERVLAIVTPLRQGRRLEFGDKEWDPRETTLTVLDGPRLEAPDLGVGQGWPNAERSSEDVTERFLAAAPPPAPPPGIVIVAVGDAPIPAELARYETIRVDLRDPEAAKALVERLRQAVSDG
jgi:hypothetical protein